jgi:hypothetical protein
MTTNTTSLVSWTTRRVDSLRQRADALNECPTRPGAPIAPTGWAEAFYAIGSARCDLDTALFWAKRGDRPRTRRALRSAVARLAEARLDLVVS